MSYLSFSLTAHKALINFKTKTSFENIGPLPFRKKFALNFTNTTIQGKQALKMYEIFRIHALSEPWATCGPLSYFLRPFSQIWLFHKKNRVNL